MILYLCVWFFFEISVVLHILYKKCKNKRDKNILNNYRSLGDSKPERIIGISEREVVEKGTEILFKEIVPVKLLNLGRC